MLGSPLSVPAALDARLCSTSLVLELVSSGPDRGADGPGHLTIIDHDTVSVSNLHRQVLHGGRAGMNKAESAVEALRALVAFSCSAFS